VELEDQLPHSQKNCNGTYSELAESSSNLHILYLAEDFPRYYCIFTPWYLNAVFTNKTWY